MKSRALALGTAASGRHRLMGFFAFLFVVAQFIAAAHAGVSPAELANHSPQSCEYCLAGALTDDPMALEFDFAAPEAAFGEARRYVAVESVVEGALRAGSPRGPPTR